VDLRKLEIFAAVAQSGGFSAGAEQLHMAQPAVSIAVRKLEDSLGVTLFDRSSRSIALTAEGVASFWAVRNRSCSRCRTWPNPPVTSRICCEVS